MRELQLSPYRIEVSNFAFNALHVYFTLFFEKRSLSRFARSNYSYTIYVSLLFSTLTHSLSFSLSSFLYILLYFFRSPDVGRASMLQRGLWDAFLSVSPSRCPSSATNAVAIATGGGTFALLHRIPVKLITSGERALAYLIRATDSWPAFRTRVVIRDSTCANPIIPWSHVASGHQATRMHDAE